MTYVGLGDNRLRTGVDELHLGSDSYDLATTGLGQASSGFDRLTTDIMRAYMDCESGDDRAKDACSRINSRVYKGGKVSS